MQLNTAEQTKNNPLAQKVIASAADYAWVILGYGGKNDLLLPLIEQQFRNSPLQGSLRRYRYWGIYRDAPSHLNQVFCPGAEGAYPVPIAGADAFMVELARQLGSFPPRLFLDPAVRDPGNFCQGVQHLLPESDGGHASFGRRTG